MKKILYAFLASVVVIFILNRIVYKEVPEAVRKPMISEVKRYQHPVKSISFNDTDFNDLKIFDSILTGNRVLMLGENTHKDGQTFKAKSRLIRYLHEHLGYNVVLYEAGQYDSWIMNQEMNTHKMKVSADSIGGLGLFDFWWANYETKPLISYFQRTKATKNPITVGGFDIQMSGGVLFDKRAGLIKDFLTRNKIDLKKYPLFSKNIDHLFYFIYDYYVNKRFNEKQKKQFLEEIKKIENRVLQLKKNEENTIYARYFNDMRNNYYKAWNFKVGSMPSMQFRDSLMAANVIHQIDSVYKDQKVIVWCANIHTFAQRYSKDYLPLGAYLKNKYGKASYMIDFSSYARQNPVNGNTIEKPGKLAVENVFHDTKVPYFFINLRAVPSTSFLKKEFVSTINQGMDEKKQWSSLFDGIFYIDINKNPTYPKK
ncbi:erythromycin esterase family protein [Chryseobacterium sp. SIMBA_029]|uniref:erythromycin esterase family protein n=1 Tax=Chryseobacterium sp. SIMBA_029 TaxID=3085772 RepID=UPI00397B0CFA